MSALEFEVESGIAVITLDVPGAPVNTLSTAVATEFDALITRIGPDPDVRGIVLISGKEDNFIAGADIEEFTRIRTAEEATLLSRRAQDLMNRVAASSKPIVAAIHGACLGGGYELALACHWRVATDHPKTQLGLPEVQLGLIPGAGGCKAPEDVGFEDAGMDEVEASGSDRASQLPDSCGEAARLEESKLGGDPPHLLLDSFLPPLLTHDGDMYARLLEPGQTFGQGPLGTARTQSIDNVEDLHTE